MCLAVAPDGPDLKDIAMGVPPATPCNKIQRVEDTENGDSEKGGWASDPERFSYFNGRGNGGEAFPKKRVCEGRPSLFFQKDRKTEAEQRRGKEGTERNENSLVGKDVSRIECPALLKNRR